MIIIGAGRHAKDLLLDLKDQFTDFVFFDDISEETSFYGYEVIKSEQEIKEHFSIDNRFIIGIGGTVLRKNINDKFVSLGGKPLSIFSNHALIGDTESKFGDGLNILPFVLSSNFVTIGHGTLINSRTSLHHDVSVGNYCEISPSCTILGGASIGDFTKIGSDSTVLPNIKIGANCTIGAKSLINKDIPSGSTVYGVPGKIIN